ncbi:hypothetical protein DM01DRAFT_1403799 [Hesseltinella vesiculosa]|uniref:Uncharacterized protein n=1 Tax=Hesseltinella vesiculosa TaxID=101127 RepID=A0A1X2GVR3_9FUNG|nr:hypothetical protein DM01DRAFT_1403799 [Hesseltinella vesiculosa]
MDNLDHPSGRSCLLKLSPDARVFKPQAEDILGDEELLDLFRIIKQITRKRPDAERLAKLLFCISYSLGDNIKQYRPAHHDTLVFRDDDSPSPSLHAVKLSYHPSCCKTQDQLPHQWALGNPDSASVHWSESPTKQQQPLSLSYLTHPTTVVPSDSPASFADDPTATEVIMDAGIVRPYTQFRSTLPYHHPHQPRPLPGTDDMLFPPRPRQNTITSTTSTLINNHDTSAADPSGTSSLYSSPIVASPQLSAQLNSMLHAPMPTTRVEPDPNSTTVVMEPRQRGFYYQYGRIEREPPLLRRFAEQGVLTQASLLRKRRRQCSDQDNPYILTTLPASTKKPKIPHRHGEFELRRDDIIHRMRSITMSDLEQKSQRLPADTTLAIEQAELPANIVASTLAAEEVADLLEPSLRILTYHSNLKPHLDNGMNQNGIYYNIDYYRLYLAFVQFQKAFATLFPHEVVKVRKVHRASSHPTQRDDHDEEDGPANPSTNINLTGRSSHSSDSEYDPLEVPLPPSSLSATVSAMSERDRDRDRNMNMKAYRAWIEPLLTETNWAAFRRNLVVGERMVLLTKVVGQGVLLMTKELSGSKLHLTFTNSEWDEFIGGLHLGKWDETIQWDQEHEQALYIRDPESKSRLVDELNHKFLSDLWFLATGAIVPPPHRKQLHDQRKSMALQQLPRDPLPDQDRERSSTTDSSGLIELSNAAAGQLPS